MDYCSTQLDEARLDALKRYDILDTPAEESFDRITRLARVAVQLPIVLVSLIDRNRQWFKSRQGIEVEETGLDVSFCMHAIRRDEPLIIRDATLDPRFKDNPLVTGPLSIRFYIGIPLMTPQGIRIGTLCGIDTVPRDPSPEQIGIMQDLAQLVVDELELRRLAAVDSMTGALTSRTFRIEARRHVELAIRNGRFFGLVMLDIDHFKRVNDTHGHPAGDRVIRAVANTCQADLRASDFFGRMGGEEFALGLPDTNLAGSAALAERIRARIAELRISHAGAAIAVKASFGVAAFRASDGDVESTIARADAALYEAKRGGRDRVVRSTGRSFGPTLVDRVA